jgi:hypothetical protein
MEMVDIIRHPNLQKPQVDAEAGVNLASEMRRVRFKRSQEAKRKFERQNPCPSTGKSSGSCPGYVIDHKKPLAKGGAGVNR